MLCILLGLPVPTLRSSLPASHLMAETADRHNPKNR